MIELSKDWFEADDENGNVVRYDILFSFDSETDGNTYIVYTADEKDESGNLIIYASYINEEKHGTVLMDIEDNDKFKAVNDMLVRFMEIARKNTEESDS